jgi:hypothetical protein
MPSSPFSSSKHRRPSQPAVKRARHLQDVTLARRNGSFHVDWVEHWANELEFSFEK